MLSAMNYLCEWEQLKRTTHIGNSMIPKKLFIYTVNYSNAELKMTYTITCRLRSINV